MILHTTREVRLILGCFLAASLSGCGGSAIARSAEVAPQAASADTESAGGAPMSYGQQPQAPGEPPPPPGPSPMPRAATADTNRPPPQELLVYEATLSIAVYQVDKAITDLLIEARSLEGQIVQRGDDRVTFRVPRARFEEALARADKVGDVLHRDVRAEDVGDQYRDLDVRLRNARAMRDRLEQLLVRAGNVKDSLEIEAQLSRVTEEIERLSGQLQLLSHRIAYSKITVLFQPRHAEHLQREVVRLPFPWLESLGLGTLLDLRE